MNNVISAFIYSYIFIIGMCLCSFFMVVGYRVVRKEGLAGRSHCENCKNTLMWWHVLPLISYIVLRGKCYFCSSKIGIQNPIFEIFIGILFVNSAYFLDFSVEMFVSFTLICLLFTVSVSDLLYQIIPNKVLFPFFIVILIERTVVPQNEFWWYPLAGILVGFFPLFLIALTKDKAIGGGDIKLFAVIGAFVGPIGVLVALFLASLTGIIFYIFSFIFVEKKEKYIPFAPSIGIGSFIVYLFTSRQMEVILQLFS